MNYFSKVIREIQEKISHRRPTIWTIMLLVGWLFVWLIPWQSWLIENIWLRVIISLIIFNLPGIQLYRLLSKDDPTTLSSIPFGFVFSNLVMSLLGTLGRFAHLPFSLVKNSYMLLGLILLLPIPISKIAQGEEPKIKLPTYRQSINFFLLLAIAILTMLLTIQRTITEDDLTYLALITKFQHAVPLDFTDIFFGSSKIIAPRFWLLSVPFSQAFLAELSGLHGIYWIGGFYEPFLALISILSLYSLARYLGLSNRAAVASIAIQIAFLAMLSNYLSPGAPFLYQLSVDKVTASFIGFPVFMQSAFQLLESPSKRDFTVCLLSGISLSLIHAVTLAFALCILGIILLIRFKLSSFRSYIPIFLIIFLALLPQVIIRFTDSEKQGSIAYSIENVQAARGNDSLFTTLGDTSFYGFNPSILAMNIPPQTFAPPLEFIFKWGWGFLPLLAFLLTINKLKHNNLAQFVFACFSLVAIAGIPFTGWLLGYFVSPRMLARTTWLYPYGLGMVFLLQSLENKSFFKIQVNQWLHNLKIKSASSLKEISPTLISISSIAIILMQMRYQNLPNMERYYVNANRYQEFSHIGQFLDEKISDHANVIGTQDLNDLLPGISGKAFVLNFRPSNSDYSFIYSNQVREYRYQIQELILSNTTPPEERLELIKKYDIQYILLKSGERHLINNLISTYPSKFGVYKIDRYIILEIRNEKMSSG